MSASPFPHAGAVFPAWLLRVACAGVGVALALVVADGQVRPLLVLVAVVGGIVPRTFLPWVLVVALGFAELARGVPTPGDPAFHVLLAGVPLVHGLGARGALLPPAARVQWRALAGPGVRYLVVQAACQAVAVLALWAAGPHRGVGTVAALVSVVALAGVVVLVVRVLQGVAGRGKDMTRRARGGTLDG